jgi:arylsulfatase A-like enzyme
MHEESIRVPFIVYDPRPGAGRHRAVAEEAVLNIDLAPTVLDFAGIDAPEGMQGRSVRAVTVEEDAAWRTSWYYEHHFARERKDFIPASEGVRTGEWKYIRYVDSEPLFEELYHVGEDPLEMRNLATDFEYADRLAGMRESWAKWRESLEPWDGAEAGGWVEPE